MNEIHPYPAYKDSGVQWLGNIPAHWRQAPGRACYRVNSIPNSGMVESTVLSLSYGHIVVKPADRLHGLVPASFETYQIVEPGDIVVRPTDLQNDWNSLRFGLSKHRGIITSAYLCFRTDHALTREFGHFLLHTYDLKKVFYGLGSGLRQNLDWNDSKYLPCLVPPLTEQAAIVRFLGHADRRIRRSILDKKKLIALLGEQKQTIIHTAVTRGLDPMVRLKPSSVPWLGDLPQHWKVTRLKFEASEIVDCLHATPRYVEAGDHPAIRTADIEAGRVRLAKARKVDADEYLRWTSRLAPKSGDILYSREGERYGIAALVPDGVALCISQRMMVFKIASRHCSAFIMWQLNSRQVYDQAASDQIGATAPHINVDRIKNYWLTLPPVDEQVAIARHIEDRCRSLEASIERIEQESALIREYRVRLIADVVTGKLDVREAAARLPDEPESDPIDDVVTDLDAEEDVEELVDGAEV